MAADDIVERRLPTVLQSPAKASWRYVHLSSRSDPSPHWWGYSQNLGAWINRKELFGAVATHTGMERREVDKALKGLTEVIEAVAAKGEQITISGFARFARVDRPARMARNPATGAPVKVKASKRRSHRSRASRTRS